VHSSANQLVLHQEQRPSLMDIGTADIVSRLGFVLAKKCAEYIRSRGHEAGGPEIFKAVDVLQRGLCYQVCDVELGGREQELKIEYPNLWNTSDVSSFNDWNRNQRKLSAVSEGL
jgi:hypothetical protein